MKPPRRGPFQTKQPKTLEKLVGLEELPLFGRPIFKERTVWFKAKSYILDLFQALRPMDNFSEI